METKPIDKNRPKTKVDDWGGNNPSCAFWIFGNDESAEKDLKDKVKVVDVDTNKKTI